MPSLQLTNALMFVSYCILQSLLSRVTSFCRLCMEMNIQLSSNPTQWHCISVDAKMSKGFADFLSHKIPGLRTICKKAKLLMGQVFLFRDSTGRRYIYNVVTKQRFFDKLD